MKKKVLIVGVMGPGESATEADLSRAAAIGRLIAKNNWYLLSGGRDTGVMGAVNKAYKEAGGILSIGILPAGKDGASEYVDVPIPTKMSSGRNFINTQASNVLIAIGDLSSAGTLSEVALGLIGEKPFDKSPAVDKPVYLLGKGILVEAICATYKNAYQIGNLDSVVKQIRIFDSSR